MLLGFVVSASTQNLPYCPGTPRTDRYALVVRRDTGECSVSVHPTLRLRFGPHVGTLYTFRLIPENTFGSWFFYDDKHMQIVPPRSDEPVVQQQAVQSIFNVQYQGSSCVTYLIESWAATAGRGDRKDAVDHTGSVYCYVKGRAVEQTLLSQRLNGVKNASEARRALAPASHKN